MTTRKKAGLLLLGLLPLPIAFLWQFLLTFPLAGLAVIGHLIKNSVGGISISELAMWSYEVMSGTTFSDVLQIVYSVTIILLFSFWLKAASKNDSRVPLKKGRQLMALLGGLVLLMIGLQYLTEIIYDGIAMISPSVAADYEELTEMAGMNEPGPLMYLYVVILGPIAEELLFRGVAMKYFRRIMPFAAANLLQALMFGIYHMNLMQSLYTLAAGLIFGLITEKCGRLLDSILAHSIFNLMGITGILYLWSDNPYYQFIWMPVMVLTLILGSMLLFPGDGERAEV